MKGKHEEIISNFFNSIVREETGEEFGAKVTGYCLIYAPYYILFLENDDVEFNDYVLREIQGSIGKGINEQVWVLFATEEVPERAYDQFAVKSLPANQSQCEIRALPLLERVLSLIHI